MSKARSRGVALVTGGGSGIGRATALSLSDDGWAVAVLGRRVGPLKTTVSRIVRRGGRAEALVGDVTCPEELEAMARAVESTLGRLDVLVNNAGVFLDGGIDTLSVEDWRRTMATNLDGVFMVSRAVLPLLKRRGGVIVNVTSSLASRGLPGAAAYCASKAAVENLTRAMALDLAPSRIRVVAVAPGIVETPLGLRGERRESSKLRGELASLHPLGRMGKPSEVAAAITQLCRRESAWITGSVHPVDGGLNAG